MKKVRACLKPKSQPGSIILVGTYNGSQLNDWPGYYNYPLFREDQIDVDFCKNIREIWLFKGTRAPLYFSAEFIGVKTRKELREGFGYPANGKGHGAGTYLLFKTTPRYFPNTPHTTKPENGDKIIVRTKDFARSPTTRKQLKTFLESRTRKNERIQNLLPEDLVGLPKESLCVFDAPIQLDFFSVIGDCIDTNVPFPSPDKPKFTFVDLFAGIGGFHLAMHELGGKCVFASEWDLDAKKTYAKNYGILPKGDITKIDERDIPKHDVLCAGFPCQSFSKAGKQLGFADETKGTLFFEVERILNYHKSKYILLENVRNLVSHDDGNTWKTIHSHLVNLGYRLTPEPLIVSPHDFGVPQLRERVVILGVYDPTHAHEPLIISLPKAENKRNCSLETILEPDVKNREYQLTQDEIEVIDAWDEFHTGIKEKVLGFPIWAEWFKKAPEASMPEWKKQFIRKNNLLYSNNKDFIDRWLAKHHNLESFTPTMRKMEWQCGTSVDSAWDAFLQMRPSGLRIKRPDCAPALVAIVQVPIIGKYRRRMTVREAARLQSFDDKFIPNANMHQAYKQFGNAVNVKVIKECARRLFDEYRP